MSTVALHLGAMQSGKHLFLDATARKTHMHVLGASGRGKSYFLEHLIRQDIRNEDGLCLIDPHGTLYHKVVTYCTEHRDLVSWDKLILLDASAPGWTFGFNPLNFGDADTSFSVDAMVNAVAQVWGGEDTSATPLLKKVLRNVFHALAEKELTLLEATYLIDERDDLKPLRKYLTDDLSAPVIREQWARWNAQRPNELREQFASTSNRLMEFLAANVIRAIIGQQNTVIDFRKVMDEGGVVLVNLKQRGTLSRDNARLLGTLITNDLFLKAQDRPEGSRPFYFYIDECGNYLNESIEHILDESRKRGLHLILANQHLAQLKKAGDTVYSAIMTNTQTKVIFGGLMSADADTMVKEVFLDLDLEEPKESLIRKVVVGQELVLLQSGSEGESESTATSKTTSVMDGTADSVSSGESVTLSEVTLPDDIKGPSTEAWGVTSGSSSTQSLSTTEAESESTARTISTMNSWAQAFKNIYKNAVGGHFTLEEQRYKQLGWLKKQPRQMALLVQPDFSLIPFRVATVREPKVWEEDTQDFIEKRYQALPFVIPETKSIEHIETRTLKLEQDSGLKRPTEQAVEHEEEDYDAYDT